MAPIGNYYSQVYLPLGFIYKTLNNMVILFKAIPL